MLTVHLRINDATGRPTPVRLRVTGPTGGHFVPLGCQVEFPVGRGESVGGHLRLGRERWCYVTGSCEIELPAGVPLRVQASKGVEYRPLDETVTLKPGQMTLRFAVERANPAPAGLFAGDAHAEFLTPHFAALEAAAEGLSFVNLLALDFPAAALDGQTYHGTPNLEAFSGQVAALTAPDVAVTVTTLNVHPVLGRVALLHSHRPVYPLTFGGADGSDDWSLSDWCDQCRRKGGYPVWVDPLESVSGVFGGEALIALLTGKIEALELDGRPRKQPLVPLWYKLLNAGFPVQLVGASGKDTNKIPLGGLRTYAAVSAGAAFTPAGWIDAVRHGRSFVTNGPLLHLTRVGDGWHAAATCLTEFDVLELVADGVSVCSAKPSLNAGLWRATLDAKPETPAGWFAARCTGGPSMTNPTQPAFAHTAPQFTGVAGRKTDATIFRRAVLSTIDWAETAGRYRDAKFRDKLLANAADALARLAAND